MLRLANQVPFGPSVAAGKHRWAAMIEFVVNRQRRRALPGRSVLRRQQPRPLQRRLWVSFHARRSHMLDI